MGRVILAQDNPSAAIWAESRPHLMSAVKKSTGWSGQIRPSELKRDGCSEQTEQPLWSWEGIYFSTWGTEGSRTRRG
jgi:hypothetical protein